MFPPGDAREDWTIYRALSDVLGVTLPYDSIGQLRTRIAAEWPHLGVEGLQPVAWRANAGVEAELVPGPIMLPIGNFYLTNPIARASETMADCVAQIVEADEPALQAAE